MPEYDFTLKFKLPNFYSSEIYVDKLYESGCDDALIGIGKEGCVALNFTRDSVSAYRAISSAIENVKEAIPEAALINVSPDLVGVTDIANLLQCSRQNIRKLMLKDNPQCPPPVYEGAQSIWHLAEILTWLVEHQDYLIKESLIETAKTTMILNLARQCQTIAPEIPENFNTLVAF